MRSEILLNAFCTEVVAVVGTEMAFAKGAGRVKSVVDATMQRWELATAVGSRL